jgi:hypothetical protein
MSMRGTGVSVIGAMAVRIIASAGGTRAGRRDIAMPYGRLPARSTVSIPHR